MGIRYQRRNRLESLRVDAITDPLYASMGATDFNLAFADEQLIYDLVNKNLDAQQARYTKDWGVSR